MNKYIILALIAGVGYWYLNWKPSASDIASQMSVSNEIKYKDLTFRSEWADSEKSITAHVRRIDRHYDKNFPIVTHDFVLTTGDYSNPDIVAVKHKGGGNYRYSWKTDKKLEGSIIFYHLIPKRAYVQEEIDKIKEGDTVKLTGKISENNKITSTSGSYIQLGHDNHKFILLNDIKQVTSGL